MDALALIPKPAPSPHYWNGVLSMALVFTLKGRKEVGKEWLDEFLRDPISQNLREDLRKELKRA